MRKVHRLFRIAGFIVRNRQIFARELVILFGQIRAAARKALVLEDELRGHGL